VNSHHSLCVGKKNEKNKSRLFFDRRRSPALRLLALRGIVRQKNIAYGVQPAASSKSSQHRSLAFCFLLFA